MNIGTQFAGLGQMVQNVKAKVQQEETAAAPAQAPAVTFNGQEHGDTVHFGASCCR